MYRRTAINPDPFVPPVRRWRSSVPSSQDREYYRVGKGRDMGFGAILGFFCKLSSGTAQMSTSRQHYRLGVRLSLGRLLRVDKDRIESKHNCLHPCQPE